MAMAIPLNHPEIVQSGLVATIRVANVLTGKWKETYGSQRENVETLHNIYARHFEAAMAECAWAKYSGQYWPGVGAYIDSVDVGEMDEVKHSAHQDAKERYDARLLVQEDGREERRFVLIVGKLGVYQYRGWMMGAEAKNREKYWGADLPRPCFAVPQSELHKGNGSS
jgi:hypothetical protein